MAQESSLSRATSLPLILSFLATLVFLPSYQSLQAEWRESDDTKAKIEFDDSKIEIKVVSRKQRRDKKNMFMELVALEHKSGKTVGQGQLLFMEISKFSDKYFYDTGVSFTKIISKWFSSDSRLEFTQREKAENYMGPYGMQRFKLNVQDCAAIQQFLGPLPIDRLRGGKKPLGTIIIRGYYCTGPNEFLTKSEVESLFNAIDVPSRPKRKYRSY